jgi:hypothetical protein
MPTELPPILHLKCNKYQKNTKGKSSPCNRPWRPLWLKAVEAPTFSRQLVHRRRQDYQPYESAGRPLNQERFPGTHFCQSLSRPQGRCAAVRIKSINKSNYLIGNRTRSLRACITVSHSHYNRRVSRILHLSSNHSIQSSGQSSWLKIQRPGFDFRHNQIF